MSREKLTYLDSHVFPSQPHFCLPEYYSGEVGTSCGCKAGSATDEVSFKPVLTLGVNLKPPNPPDEGR